MSQLPKIVVKLRESQVKSEVTLPPLVISRYESVYYFQNDHKSNKIAMFDLDDTIAYRGHHNHVTEVAITWSYPEVPETLRRYYHQGYKVIVLSNQNGIDQDPHLLEVMIQRLGLIYTQLGIPIEFYFAVNKDAYRKPMTGTWDFILRHLQLNRTQVDASASFYCGDAGGRVKNYLPHKPKDFNITDRYFAYNAGLPFHTPEHIFLGLPDTFLYEDKYGSQLNLTDYYPTQPYPVPPSGSSHRHLIILTGAMASGKTTLTRDPIWHDYVILNNDTLKSTSKLLSLLTQALDQGRSVMIDNTNPKRETRQIYLQLAKVKDYQVLCYYFDFPKLLSIHLNQMRTQLGQSKPVPMVAIHSYYKALEPPTLAEGFDQIVTFNRMPRSPDSGISDQFDQYYYYHYDLQ